MEKIIWKSKPVRIDLIDPTPTNYKIQTKLGRERLKQSLKQFGMAGTVVCNYSRKKGRYDLIDGNSRVEEAKEKKVKVIEISVPSRKLSDKEYKEMAALFDFAVAGEVDVDRISSDLGRTKDFFNRWGMLQPAHILNSIGKNATVSAEDFRPEKEKEKEERDKKSVLLRDKFIEPPFSVLDARNGNWQKRKREWLELGIRGELGRGEELLEYSKTVNKGRRGKKGKVYNMGKLAEEEGKFYRRKPLTQSIPIKSYSTVEEYYTQENQALNTSIFDPALCELMYAWFCPKKGAVLDPFAGGSVRGIVAHYLGYQYTGIDLSRKQIEANIKQGKEILKKNNQPLWLWGDSEEVLRLDKKFKTKFDFIFSCPPYYDLEVYSKDKNDLSALKTYDEFRFKYQKIVESSLGLLKPNRYVCFVVTQIRDKKGYYRDLVGDTVTIFERCGARFYNDAVLVTMVGSASMRADKQFTSSKKLVRVHQNVLVFYKPGKGT